MARNAHGKSRPIAVGPKKLGSFWAVKTEDFGPKIGLESQHHFKTLLNVQAYDHMA